MKYICPVCNKEFATLVEYAQHMSLESRHEAAEKAAEEKLRKEREETAAKTLTQINKVLKELEVLIARYNANSDEDKAYINFSIKDVVSKKSTKDNKTITIDQALTKNKVDTESLESFLRAILLGY